MKQAADVICKLLPRWLTNHTCIELPASKFAAPLKSCDSISYDAPDVNRFKKETIFCSAGDIVSSKLK